METQYAERLTVPLRWWVQGTMLVVSLWLATVVALPGIVAWTVTAVGLALMAAVLLSYGAARIEVGESRLRAGRAGIEVRHLGDATALDADAARRLAGRDADARAYLLLRPYLKRAVRVDLHDPADPAPYWLLSTRHPDALAQAIATARGPVAPQGGPAAD
ncbi:DUF3093 domain-containing protein [Nocardioides aestuarii]|uniref:DUF3093 domain-containing protein n=1 Tax=Nocardioides aestuarii TaxID=252231 RepID=A0ABW4TKD4_9ACTN